MISLTPEQVEVVNTKALEAVERELAMPLVGSYRKYETIEYLGSYLTTGYRELRPNKTSPYTMDTCEAISVVAEFHVRPLRHAGQTRQRKAYITAFFVTEFETKRETSTHWDVR